MASCGRTLSGLANFWKSCPRNAVSYDRGVDLARSCRTRKVLKGLHVLIRRGCRELRFRELGFRGLGFRELGLGFRQVGSFGEAGCFVVAADSGVPPKDLLAGKMPTVTHTHCFEAVSFIRVKVYCRLALRLKLCPAISKSPKP